MNARIAAVFFLLSIPWGALLQGYTLPSLGLGTSSFLDGGPLRQVPGWYWQTFLQTYNSNKFVSNNGSPLPEITDPHLSIVSTALQLIYLSTRSIFGGSVGFDVTLPIRLHAGINKNIPVFSSSGAGLGDFSAGVYLQWNPIIHGDRPIFVHRLEFLTVFPTGKNKLLEKTINPGNRIFYCDPYWAATVYFTPRFTASWRLHYLWCGTNHKTHIQPGQAVHFNYAIDYAVTEQLILGVAGYYLRQVTASTFLGVKIPDSKERVFAIGPGALWAFARKYTFVLVANIYFETDVRNRPQGIRGVLRILRHF